MPDTLQHLVDKFHLTLQPRRQCEVRGINRHIMADVLAELDFKVGVEVGVAQGWHAEILCQANPQAKLYAVDIWGRYTGYVEYHDRIDKYYREAQERLKPYNCELVKKFSNEASQDFADYSLDFVYIDAAHDFMSVAVDLGSWARKVRIGGIVFGHDYNRGIRTGGVLYGVKDAVGAFAYSFGVDPLLILKNDVQDPKFNMDSPGWAFVRSDKDLINVNPGMYVNH